MYRFKMHNRKEAQGSLGCCACSMLLFRITFLELRDWFSHFRIIYLEDSARTHKSLTGKSSDLRRSSSSVTGLEEEKGQDTTHDSKVMRYVYDNYETWLCLRFNHLCLFLHIAQVPIQYISKISRGSLK
jgi:hypothetical protein